MRIEELADAADDLDLARFRHAGEAAGQLADDLVLPAAQLVEIDLRHAERDAVIREHLRLVHHRGDVQQRLRRNAADVEADAAELRVALDEHSLHSEIGRAERGAVAAGASAQHEHLALDVDLAGVGRGTRNRRGRRRWRCGGCGSRRRSLRGGGRGRRGGILPARGRRWRCRRSSARFEHGNQRAFADLVTHLQFQFLDRSRGWRGNVHRRLVGLQRDERILGGDGVARLHEDFDYRDVLEVADVGNLDVDRGHFRVA